MPSAKIRQSDLVSVELIKKISVGQRALDHLIATSGVLKATASFESIEARGTTVMFKCQRG